MLLPHLPHDSHEDRLAAALARGIITREQYEAILAIGEDEEPDVAPPRGLGRELRRGLSWVSAAYAIGASIVLFAFGWFLVDRWRALGPGGILLVVSIYAALFTGIGIALRRQGYRTAGGIAITLAVALAPIVAWSAQRVLGLWPGWTGGWWGGGPDDGAWMTAPWIVIDLFTILVSLVALRRVRFPLLVAPIAIALWALAFHLAGLVWDAGVRSLLADSISLAVGTGMLAIAYAVDRRDERRADYAGWLYAFGLLAAGIGYLGGWSDYGAWRHAAPVVALLLVAAALHLRRRVLLLAGMIALVGYLGYLTFDVFRDLVSFPILLATFGGCVILLAVLVQQRWPRLVERMEEARGLGRPTLPGGWVAATGPFVLAVGLLVIAAVEAPERAAERAWRERFLMRHHRNQARADSIRAAEARTREARARETPSRAKP